MPVWAEDAMPWLPRLSLATRPLYRAIADAIAEDIASGRLAPNQQLPTQRQLAEHLGINFTTVTRAYNEARERGLIEARVGSGSYVRGEPRPPKMTTPLPPPEVRRGADMSMNLPPEPADTALAAQMQAGLAALQPRLPELLRYQEFGGSIRDREAGANWLSRHWPEVPVTRLQVCSGAQSALLSILTLLKATEPDAVVCCAALTYPGLRAVAGQLGIRLVGLPVDEAGIDPEAFAAACARYSPRALYCNPTLHNPTTYTMPPARREAIAEVARHYQVPIIEDDAYAALPRQPVAPLASYAPELTYYIAGLAKCLGAGLRLAYVVAPGQAESRRLAGALRATTVMASPVSAALATEWIESGVGARWLEAIRNETRARYALVGEWLPQGSFRGQPDAFHIWIPLASHWSRAAFAHRLGSFDISVVPSDAFTVSGQAPEAVRVCLGGTISRESLAVALGDIAQTLQSRPDQHIGVI